MRKTKREKVIEQVKFFAMHPLTIILVLLGISLIGNSLK